MPDSTFETRNVYPSNDTNFYFMAPHVVIDDPLNQGNNVGKSSFRYPNIKVSNYLTLKNLIII